MSLPQPNDPSPEPGTRLKTFQDSAPVASWVFGGLILIFLMVVVFVKVDSDKYPIIGFMMALSAAFFAFFFVGGVLMQGTVRGVYISATGGFVLFILLQFVFPPYTFIAKPQPTPQLTPQATPPSGEPTGAEKSVDDLQDAILSVKGEYEAMFRYTGAAREHTAGRVHAQGTKLGQAILNISDDNLRISYQVRKYEYAILAHYMAAAAADDVEKIRLTNLAIGAARDSLKRMDRAKELASTGDPYYVGRYTWLLQDDQSLERINWFYAVALAINAKAGGGHTVQEVAEVWGRIPNQYKKENPADTNPYILWAIQSAGQN